MIVKQRHLRKKKNCDDYEDYEKKREMCENEFSDHLVDQKEKFKTRSLTTIHKVFNGPSQKYIK